MMNLPVFGEQMRRLAELRGLDVGSLARAAGVAETAITSLSDGAEPDPSLLRRLAPLLDLHRSDLFVIAGQPVPDDLAVRDVSAVGAIWRLVAAAGRGRLHKDPSAVVHVRCRPTNDHTKRVRRLMVEKVGSPPFDTFAALPDRGLSRGRDGRGLAG
ncbi:hypothetical protein ACQP00_32815 [Dactylosporangium sp. CS-047395]|uniref:hypothetical protein n=1 Tax=Dactylosporangium sp. CS-047395 TaxID=3239936 RepID=UPI003D8D9635